MATKFLMVLDYKCYMTLIVNRVRLLFKIFRNKNIFGILFLTLTSSLFFFEKNTILAALAISTLIDTTRKDTIFCQILYADLSFNIKFVEYLFIFIFFGIISIITKDEFLIYSPFIFLIFIVVIKKNYIAPFSLGRQTLFANFYIHKQDFIWKSGIRRHILKLTILSTAFTVIGYLSNIYQLSIFYLFFSSLFFSTFYENKIPLIFFNIDNINIKRVALNIYSNNLISLLKTIFIPVTIQFFFISENIFQVTYFLSCIISMPILLFLCLINNILYSYNKSSKFFITITNRLTSIIVLFPFLSIIALVYSLVLLRKLVTNKIDISNTIN